MRRKIAISVIFLLTIPLSAWSQDESAAAGKDKTAVSASADKPSIFDNSYDSEAAKKDTAKSKAWYPFVKKKKWYQFVGQPSDQQDAQEQGGQPSKPQDAQERGGQ